MKSPANTKKNTGKAIVETFETLRLNPHEMRAVLAAWHAPFVWGDCGANAVENAKALEICADMALKTLLINPHAANISAGLKDRHFLRKHGKNAYYGQH